MRAPPPSGRSWGPARPRIPGRLAVVAVLAAAAMLVACTERGPDRIERPAPLPTGGEEPTADAIPTVRPGAEPGNRLLVVDPAGRILTMAPDGSDPIALTDPASEAARSFQPTWSPDGRSVAWTQVETAGSAPVASVVTSGFDGTGRTEAVTPVAGFYLAWDPTSSRVAFLGASGPGEDIELGIVDVGAGDPAVHLDTGQPLYFSWAPDGRRLLLHVGPDRLEEVTLDGERSTVAARPGDFQAPAWSADGRRLVYVSRRSSGQQLVVASGGRERGLLSFDGPIAFVLSPGGDRVAYQVVGGGGPNDRVLSVVDVRTQETVALSPVPSLAFFWSPTGDRLLFLRPMLFEDELWFRWVVWDGAGFFQTERFRPSQTFGRQYLPFFDQFAQSMTLWSPDGSAFAYAGIDEDGVAGVWVQEARRDVPPAYVTEGVFVSWSPA